MQLLLEGLLQKLNPLFSIAVFDNRLILFFDIPGIQFVLFLLVVQNAHIQVVNNLRQFGGRDVVLRFKDELRHYFFNFLLLAVRAKILFDKLAGQLSAVLLIGFGGRDVDDVMEEKGKLEYNNLFGVELRSFFVELRRIPGFKNGEDVMVGVVESPILRVAGVDLVPPSLCELVLLLVL